MSRCRTCQAPIIWAETVKGGRAPLERAAPDDTIVFVLRAGVAIAAPPDAFPDEQLYRSHFASCPEADEHRRRR